MLGGAALSNTRSRCAQTWGPGRYSCSLCSNLPNEFGGTEERKAGNAPREIFVQGCWKHPKPCFHKAIAAVMRTANQSAATQSWEMGPYLNASVLFSAGVLVGAGNKECRKVESGRLKTFSYKILYRLAAVTSPSLVCYFVMDQDWLPACWWLSVNHGYGRLPSGSCLLLGSLSSFIPDSIRSIDQCRFGKCCLCRFSRGN